MFSDSIKKVDILNMEIIYTEHLKLRLDLRNIPLDYPKLIYEVPEQKFIDSWEGSYIAICCVV